MVILSEHFFTQLLREALELYQIKSPSHTDKNVKKQAGKHFWRLNQTFYAPFFLVRSTSTVYFMRPYVRPLKSSLNFNLSSERTCLFTLLQLIKNVLFPHSCHHGHLRHLTLLLELNLHATLSTIEWSYNWRALTMQKVANIFIILIAFFLEKE